MTYTNQTKSSSSWGNGTLHSSSFSNQTKTVKSDYILLENGFYMLKEDAYKILLEQQTEVDSGWANATKD